MIVLFIEESKKQIVSGIPEYITVSVNEPATIFYTLDGSEPTEDSDVYVDKIFLTYDSPLIVLKLFALGIDSQSDIIEHSWAVDVPDYNRHALTGREGINILPEGKAVVDSLAVDTEGDVSKSSSIDFKDLDIKTNTTDRIGQPISGGSSVSFVKFPKRASRPLNEEVSSPNDNNQNFNPRASVIIVSGYNGVEDQSVRIINRPHGTMRPTSSFYDGRIQYDPMISGDLVRYFYNPKTQKLVLYYRESLDGRWIISTQKVKAATLNLTPKGNPFVFRWISHRAQSRIF